MKVSNAAQQLQNNLDEMKRRDDLESLRTHLIFENCFPPNKNPETAVITMDELKKLARAWKLHERRNFWKTHTEKDVMVDALLQHLIETGKVKGNSTVTVTAPLSPTPPSLSNRRSSLSGKQALTSTNSRTATVKHIDNYCGKKYFVREVTDVELTISSRFSEIVTLDTALSELIAQWRLDDMNNGITPASESKEAGGFVRKRGNTLGNNPKDTFTNAAVHVINMLESSHAMQTGMSTQERLLKHRKLAYHLAYFSLMSEEDKKTKVTLDTIKSYLTVCDTDDWIVASHCVIGLCNLSSRSSNRAKLIELNAIHKLSSLLPLIRLANPIQAGLTLLYYLSCEMEVEDRLFDCGFQLMATYCARNTSKAGAGVTPSALPAELLGEVGKYQLITLNTLNNILPAIDRIRVTELILSISRDCLAHITKEREGDVDSEHLHVLESFVLVLKNCGLFTNVHNTLFIGDILDILSNITSFIKEELDAQDEEHRYPQEYAAVTMAKLLNSLLHSQDNCYHYLSVDFVSIIADLFALATDYPQLCKYLVRCISVLSCSVKLQENVTDSDIVTTVTTVMLNMPLDSMTVEIARDASVFMYNITCTRAEELLERLVDYQVPYALIRLIKFSITKKDVDITVIAVKSLHNLIYDPKNSVSLAKDIIDPLIQVINLYHDLGAAQALYNLSCHNENDLLLYQYKLHLILLNNINCTDNIEVKSMYIVILVQMSSNITCIHELVQNGVCHTFASKILNSDTIKIWDSVSQFICAIVSIYYKESSEFRGNVPSILKLLKVMCIKQAQEVVLINCAVIVSYISIIIPEFTQEIDNIVRTILQLSDHEKVLESISITLYNYSCYSKSESDRDDTTTPSSSVKALLKDSYYLNIMVRMMRKGNNDVQLNIANAIMNMAAIPRCTVLLKESNSNILSDLVVIALLRTSSMSIKQVCAQVFYNMLCHDETRTRLVASEFWWGICRLCRTDDLMIRNLFAKIMFECSLHAELIPIIREHNIITCIKDVIDITEVDAINNELVDKYMVCVQNMLRNFQPLSAGSLFSRNESIFLVRLCITVLLRPVSHQSVGICIKILLKCVLQVNTIEDKVDLEYIGLDVVNALLQSSSIWMSNVISDTSLPLIVSQLILQLCKISTTFTKLVILAEGATTNESHVVSTDSNGHQGVVHACLAPLLMQIYTASSKRLVGENLLLIMFIYMVRHGPAPSAIITMPIFEPLLVDILVKNTQYTLPLKKLAIFLLCYIVQDCLKLQPTLFTASLVNSILLDGTEYLTDLKTRKHFLHFIEKLSTHPLTARNLFQSSMLKVLSKYIEQCRKFSQGEVLAAIDLTSIIIKNSSLHYDLLETMIVSSSGLPAILEQIANEQLTEASAWNLCVLLCKACLHSTGCRDTYALTPSFVLALCEKLIPLTKEVNIVRRFKYVISIVLELYSTGLHVDPTFIQAIFLEMQSVENMRLNRKIPVEMRDEPFSTASLLDANTIVKKIDTDYLQLVHGNIQDAVLSFVITLGGDNEPYKKWKVYVLQEVQTIEHMELTMKKTVPFFFLNFEMVELYPVDAFQKIVMFYPNIVAHDESADDDMEEEGEEGDAWDEGDEGDEKQENDVSEHGTEEKTVASPEYKDDFTVESRVSVENSYLNDDFEEDESVAAK